MYKISQYFPLYGSSTEDIKIKIDLENYATKDDIKNITHVDVSSYAIKTNLAALKAEVDKIDKINQKQCLMRLQLDSNPQPLSS